MKQQFKTLFIAVTVVLCICLGAHTSLADDMVISSDITTSELWSADNTYILNGIIFITDGATLTIEPGTVIRGMPDSETSGNNNPGTLIIARGSKIFANGTCANPIVFTDMEDDNVPGGAKTNPVYNNNPSNMISENWGGVILLGATYIANDTESGPNAAREEQVEGVTRDDAVFGGGDDDDSSGSMSYVSIRYGGFGLLENEEINGLTLGAVGRGTTLHHIEVVNNVDDGFEFFGGTVNSKYIIIWNIGDDSMDSDEGYRGKSQFGLVVKGACKTGESGSGGGVGNNGFEMDGGNSPDQSRPYALSQWRNYTVIGMGAGTTDPASDADNGFEIRDNARPQIYHSIVMDMGGFAADIEDLADPAIDSAAGWTTPYNNYPDDASFYPTQQQGFQTEIADCLFYNTVGAVDNGNIGIMDASKMNTVLATSPIQNVQRVAAPGYNTIMMVSSLDPRPTAVAMGIQKALPSDGFFTPVDYYGAFGPNDDWTDCWSLISSMGVLGTGQTDDCTGEWTNISGTVTYDGTPVIAMVLANGQHGFSSENDMGFGLYDLEVPMDEDCDVTIQCFAAGFEPFRIVLSPEEAANFDISMTRPEVDSQEMEITLDSEPSTEKPNWVRITGTVSYGEIPVIAMVLANGQSGFSSESDMGLGLYDLVVPLNNQGEIILQVFAAGFAPYREVFTP